MKTLRPTEDVTAGYLKSVALFANETVEQLRPLAAAASVHMFDKGEFVFQAGDAATELVCLARGGVRVLRYLPDGNEKVFHLHRAPCLVAEAPTLLGERYPASAECSDECVVVKVPRDALFELGASRPDMPWRLMGNLFRRLQELTGSLASHAQKSAVVRLASYLLGFGAEHAEVDLPASKKDIANYLGLRPETFSRALATLKERGCIAVEDERIRILDRSALEAVLQS